MAPASKYPHRRPFTADEQATIDAFNEDWRRRHDALATKPYQLVVPGALLLVVCLALIYAGIELGFYLAPVAALLLLVGIAHAATPKDAPALHPSPHAEAAQAVERSIQSKRVVYALDDLDGVVLYILFDQGDGRWRVHNADEFPAHPDLQGVLAHQEVTWSVTDTGLPLVVEGSGTTVPSHGAIGSSNAEFDRAVHLGYVWDPPPLNGNSIPESKLPTWMTDWSTPPVPEVDFNIAAADIGGGLLDGHDGEGLF